MLKPWASAHIGANKVSWPPGKWMKKIKSESMQKKSSFLCLCYIFRAIRAGLCRERRYADHIFSQIYFRMYHFAVKFSKKLPQAARGHWPPNQNPADVPGFIVLQSVDPVISIIPSAVDFLSHSKLSLQTGPGNFSLFSFYHSVYTAHWRLRDCAPINLLLTMTLSLACSDYSPLAVTVCARTHCFRVKLMTTI